MAIRLLLYLIFVAFFSKGAIAQITEDRIKANVLYHISDFISWPSLERDQTFNIVVLGYRPELVDELSRISQKKKIAKRAIEIMVEHKMNLDTQAQIIFVDEKFHDRIDSILFFCQSNQILMVTDQFDNPLKTVINFKKNDRKSVQFEVNKQNLILSGLDYAHDLLLYGGSEVDIKELFFKTQHRLDSTANQLMLESIKIDKLEKVIDSKNSTIKSYDSTINAFSDSIIVTRRKLKQQSAGIEEKTQAIEMLIAEIYSQNKKVAVINSEIQKQLTLQYKLNHQIARNKEELRTLQDEILDKNETLDQQDAFITNQRRLLYYSLALGAMMALVAFTIFRFFKLKKRHNAQLEEKINERTIELKQSNERFLSLFNNAPEAIWEIDFSEVSVYTKSLKLGERTPMNNSEYALINMECAKRMRFINVNRAALDLFEIPSIEDSIDIYKRLNEARRLSAILPEFMCVIHNVHTSTFETIRRNAQGERIDLIVKWLSINETDTPFSRVIVTMVDITKLRQAQTELSAHQERLELLVEEKTQSLKSTNKELEMANNELYDKSEIINSQNLELRIALEHLKETQTQLIQSEKMASLGVLTAGVAHEINNPLNFIMGAYVGLDRYLSQTEQIEDDHEAKAYLNSLKTGLERVSGIVKGLNLFSRENKTNNEFCHIHAIIDNCLTIVNSQISDRIEVIKDFSSEEITVIGNVGRLHQVFLNVISNASQAIVDTGRISISTTVNQGYVIIEVLDSGEGISSENISKITDPFFTTKEPGVGTGLGLSICYNIIREHKGELHFDSVVGEGTMVRMRLPIY